MPCRRLYPVTPAEALAAAKAIEHRRRFLSREAMNREHENECNWCGSPILAGEPVYYDLQQGTTYCSRTCAERDAPAY